jgi:hypothetical protein
MSAKRHAVIVCFTAIALAFLPAGTRAQDVADPNLKAAYIYRLATFAAWPASALPGGSPLTMCVIGDRAVSEALDRAMNGMTVDSRPVTVVFGTPDKPPSSCHTLYVSAVSAAQATRVVTAVRGTPVLTMSDLEGFNRMGGIVELFFQAGRLQFSIRADAATQSSLQLSSRLLQLSRPQR